MSLKDQWDAARMQRQQEVSQRHQDIAALLAAFHQHRQEVAQEQAHQRAAYIAAIRDYVWG
ncbi:MAG: hypothetical protein F6K09_19865 [Merismopedia sp. SIO2A8]|nr:hypothetical protein [Merismopedia sp. SIO2A8]